MKLISKYMMASLGLVLAQSMLSAVPLSPWFGNVYEFDAKAYYNHIRNPHHQVDVANLQLGFVPDAKWATDIECQVGHPVIKAQVRYLWLNDCAGDGVSLTSGISYAGVSRQALQQPLFLYHSRTEGEMHAALGKEFGFYTGGFFRAWSALVGGVGRNTAPWGKFLLNLDAIIKKNHLATLILEEGKGFGDKRASPHFSHTRYHYADLGLQYRFSEYGYGSIFASVKRRIAAHHCPKHVSAFELGLEIPFSF